MCFFFFLSSSRHFFRSLSLSFDRFTIPAERDSSTTSRLFRATSLFFLSFLLRLLFFSLSLSLSVPLGKTKELRNHVSYHFGHVRQFPPVPPPPFLPLNPSRSLSVLFPSKSWKSTTKEEGLLPLSLSLPRRTLKFSRCTPRRIVSSVRLRF